MRSLNNTFLRGWFAGMACTIYLVKLRLNWGMLPIPQYELDMHPMVSWTVMATLIAYQSFYNDWVKEMTNTVFKGILDKIKDKV